MRTKDAVGKYGEELAARYLVEAGFAILERNWRCELGEIDIVARDGDTLVVCEVKTRTSTTHGTALESVSGRKLTQLRRSLSKWLELHGVHPDGVRIDVVTVWVPPSGGPQVERIAGVA
jgi:putative endonuclease